MKHSETREAGFTLIEALIALAITALATVCFAQSLAAGMLASVRAQKESHAYEIAQNALTFAEGSGAGPIAQRRELADGLTASSPSGRGQILRSRRRRRRFCRTKSTSP